jgi:hypothetical protein
MHDTREPVITILSNLIVKETKLFIKKEQFEFNQSKTSRQIE